MNAFIFLGVLIGGLNCILLGIVIFILKQPDPSRGRTVTELQELQERVTELAKHLVAFEKKMEKNIQDTKSESIARIDKVNQEVGRQLKDIHDNL